jgi:NAD-dependent DNA ligase
MRPLPEITEIQRWKIEPGDRIIVRLAADIVSEYQADLIKNTVRYHLALAPDFPVLVTTPGTHISVISGEET